MREYGFQSSPPNANAPMREGESENTVSGILDPNLNDTSMRVVLYGDLPVYLRQWVVLPFCGPYTGDMPNCFLDGYAFIT